MYIVRKMSSKSEIICFHITKREKEFLEKIAKNRGITLSELLREIIFDYIIDKEKIK